MPTIAKKRPAKKTAAAPVAVTYVLRTCDAHGQSHGGFQWPESGPVEAPDWKPTPECGRGLHGLLHGEGDSYLLNWAADARWLVVEVEVASIVDLGGKVKYPKGVVVYSGDQFHATREIARRCPEARAIVGLTATAGAGGTATAGDEGTATAGDWGTATAGAGGTLCLWWYDGIRYRLAVGYVGENGIEANVPHRLDGSGHFVRATPAQQEAES